MPSVSNSEQANATLPRMLPVRYTISTLRRPLHFPAKSTAPLRSTRPRSPPPCGVHTSHAPPRQPLGSTTPNRAYARLEILNPLPVLLKLHTPRVIYQDHHVKEGNLDQVRGELDGEAPGGCKRGEGAGLIHAVGDLLELLGVLVEGLEVLLLC